jgi:hypothetical protein
MTSKFLMIYIPFRYLTIHIELKDGAKDTKFWTSASSEKCPKEFGWCGSTELMDFEGLEISREGLDASKLCLTASLNPSTSRHLTTTCADAQSAGNSSVLLRLIYIICKTKNTVFATILIKIHILKSSN